MTSPSRTTVKVGVTAGKGYLMATCGAKNAIQDSTNKCSNLSSHYRRYIVCISPKRLRLHSTLMANHVMSFGGTY